MDVERELRGIAGADPDRSFERVAAFLADAPAPRPRRRRRLLAVPLALLLIAAVPIPREEPIGQLLRWRVLDSAASLQRLEALPWAPAAMRFAEVPPAGEVRGAVLLLFIPDASERDARVRQRELARLPGTRGVELRPLTTTVRRPLGAVAARELVGLRLGADLSPDEVERRVAAVIESLAAGSVVVKLEAPGGGTRMLVLPPGSPGSATEVLAKDDDKLVLMVVSRKASGTETVRIELDASELAALSDEERTRYVTEELKRRGIDDVDVVWENGSVRLRSRTKR
jgi:hypothetical protein